ncbi:MAG: hypothetical protein AB1425_01040 [Actinomycetota bacterium]
MESLPDSLEHQDLAIRFDLPGSIGVETLEGDSARLQSALEGAEQSATRRGDEVVEVET